jgi:hypothetical protein
LVCFQPSKSRTEGERGSVDEASGIDDFAASDRQKNMLVRKGIECGLQLLARLSHYRVYLTAEEILKHRAPNGERKETQKQTIFDAMTSEINNDKHGHGTASSTQPLKKVPTSFEENNYFSVKNWVPAFMKKHSRLKRESIDKDRRASEASELSVGTSDIQNAVDLELHMALSCGNVTNIIVGDADLTESATILNPTLYPQARLANPSGDKTVQDEFFIEYHGRLEYAIGGDVVDSLDEALSLAKAGELSITPAACEIVQRQSMNLNFESRRNYYVIKNITEDLSLHKNSNPHPSPLRHDGTPASRKISSVLNNNSDYLQTLPGLRTQANKLSIEPLMPRVRNTCHMNLPVGMNRYYFKYISRSALYRMKHSVDANIAAQFRDVTIMFISLGKTDVCKREGLIKVQKAVLLAIQNFVKFEGMLQQFAIDDKGNVFKK